ncbi:MAG: EAL domain-containing protein, partial [Candidatus Thiodiazotropha taylori]
TIIALGRTLNKVVIAEGIEYSDQQDFLRQEGCDEGQGFLFSRPMTGRQFIEFAENNGQQARLTTLQS